MTDLAERLERCASASDPAWGVESAADLMREAAAALRACAVRPLVFSPREEYIDQGLTLAADCPFGRYFVGTRNEAGYGWKRAGAYIFQGFEPTEEAAQTAAQADYERRIRSALIAGPSERVAGLRMDEPTVFCGIRFELDPTLPPNVMEVRHPDGRINRLNYQALIDKEAGDA